MSCKESTVNDKVEQNWFTSGSSAVGFGTAGIFREARKKKRQRLLDAALDAGITHFDTAAIYGLGLAEGELGRAIRGRRDGIRLVSKVGIGLTPLGKMLGRVQGPMRMILESSPLLQRRAQSSAASPTSGPLGALLYRDTYDEKAAQRSLDNSLRHLGTDHLDLLLLHDPSPTRTRLEGVYEVLERAQAAGKISSWGVAGELDQTLAVVEQLPGPSSVLQIRDDIFRQDEYLSRPAHCEYLITFGVLGRALPAIIAHITASKERTRSWNDTVGVDCTKSEAVAGFLMMDAVRANPLGTVLYSTTRPERIQGMIATLSGVANQENHSFKQFRQLVDRELKTNGASLKDEQ